MVKNWILTSTQSVYVAHLMAVEKKKTPSKLFPYRAIIYDTDQNTKRAQGALIISIDGETSQ